MMSAFGGSYCKAGFSERDFTALIRSLVTGTFYPPPGTGMKADDSVEFFAPYSCLLQSSCSGKTRFLLDPIKQDRYVQCIYFSCQPNPAIGVSDGSYTFLLENIISTDNIPEMPRRLAAMYCFIVRSISVAAATWIQSIGSWIFYISADFWYPWYGLQQVHNLHAAQDGTDPHRHLIADSVSWIVACSWWMELTRGLLGHVLDLSGLCTALGIRPLCMMFSAILGWFQLCFHLLYE